MATKSASVSLSGGGLRFVATTGSGHELFLDDATGNSGPRPAELLLVSQAGCTAMDVISILRKKRQDVDRYEVVVRGVQRDDPPPHVFERIEILHILEGRAIDPVAVRRAVELSATRYCTVSGNLAAGVAEIHHAFVLRIPAGQGGAAEHYEEVAVTGPGYDAVAAAESLVGSR